MLQSLFLLPLLLLGSGGLGVLTPETHALTVQRPGVDDLRELTPIYPCWARLDCSFLEIEDMPMPDRLVFLRTIVVDKLTLLNSADQVGAVEGLMNFLIGKKLAQTKTYLSCLNAAVIEGVQRGCAIALGQSTETGGNPSSLKWAKFFVQYKRGQLNDRNYHDIAWATSEQSAIEYGSLLAETLPGIERPSLRITRFVKMTRVYRSIMLYRRTIIWLLRLSFAFTNPSVAFSSEEILNWLTDITHADSIQFLGEVSWALSALTFAAEGKDDPVGDAEVALELITGLWHGFQARNEMPGNKTQFLFDA